MCSKLFSVVLILCISSVVHSNTISNIEYLTNLKKELQSSKLFHTLTVDSPTPSTTLTTRALASKLLLHQNRSVTDADDLTCINNWRALQKIKNVLTQFNFATGSAPTIGNGRGLNSSEYIQLLKQIVNPLTIGSSLVYATMLVSKTELPTTQPINVATGNYGLDQSMAGILPYDGADNRAAIGWGISCTPDGVTVSALSEVLPLSTPNSILNLNPLIHNNLYGRSHSSPSSPHLS